MDIQDPLENFSFIDTVEIADPKTNGEIKSPEVSADNLQLLQLSLKIISKSAKLAGMDDTAKLAKDGVTGLKWLKTANKLQSGDLSRSIQESVENFDESKQNFKNEANFWIGIKQYVNAAIPPIKLLANYFSGNMNDDHTEMAAWHQFSAGILNEELTHLKSAVKTISPELKFQRTLASIQKVQNLSASASAEEKQAAYLEMTKKVAGLAKYISSACGYKSVAEALGLLTLGCGVVKVLQTPKPTSKETFSSLQQETVTAIRSQIQDARYLIEQQLSDEYDPQIRQLLQELNENLLLNESVYCEYAQDAQNCEHLLSALNNFDSQILSLLRINGLNVNTTLSKPLIDKIRIHSDDLGKKQDKMDLRLDKASRQIQSDLQHGEEVLSKLYQGTQSYPKDSAQSKALISKIVTVRMTLLSQQHNITDLQETKPKEGSSESDITNWLKKANKRINNEMLMEVHKIQESLISDI